MEPSPRSFFDRPVLDQQEHAPRKREPHRRLGPGLRNVEYGCYRNVDQLEKALYARIEGSLPVLEDRGILFIWSDAEKSFNWALPR